MTSSAATTDDGVGHGQVAAQDVPNESRSEEHVLSQSQDQTMSLDKPQAVEKPDTLANPQALTEGPAITTKTPVMEASKSTVSEAPESSAPLAPPVTPIHRQTSQAHDASTNQVNQEPSTPTPQRPQDVDMTEAPSVRDGDTRYPHTQAEPSVSHPDHTTALSVDPSSNNNVPGNSTTQALPNQQESSHNHPNNSLSNPNADAQPPSTPYNSASMRPFDQQSYSWMVAAIMSQGQSQAMSPPPTVTPSQVTFHTAVGDGHNVPAAVTHEPLQDLKDKNLESFARLEFADSVFQMTTYAVIIGRDQSALLQARADERRNAEHQKLVDDCIRHGRPAPSPIARNRSKFSKSYVSEEGGMLGPESDSESNERTTKRRKPSTTGSSNQDHDEATENMISNRQYVSHTPGAAALDLSTLRPSPWHTPFIGIHSPGPNIASKTKAISREHLKIAYNLENGVFEASPLHKNGFFCEDVHYKKGHVVLKCGDRLQIKDVDFCFKINGVAEGKTGAEDEAKDDSIKHRHSQGGKEMSFDFEHTHGNGDLRETSDELSDVEGTPPELSDFGDEPTASASVAQPEPMSDVEETGETPSALLNPELMSGMEMPQIPRKRGPGRPPKNGIMSKREQRLLKKQQQEMAKKTLPQEPPMEPPIKRKVGRPRKHPLPEDGLERAEKRKYKPRKPKGEDGAEGSDAERRAKEKKDKRVRPKSPPLELKIEDYTEEQLQKPNKNYGVLIDETLTAAGPDGLTLKQIYKRICQRYPWFYFHTETKGWESSVRHNLIGNEAFKKDETTNLWSRVPGVELDAGKKRKASSPDRAMSMPGYGPYSYPYNGQQMPLGAHGFPPSNTGSGYPMHHGFNAQQQAQGGRPVQQFGNSASPTGQPTPPVASQQPGPPQMPGYGPPPPAPARTQPGAPQPGAYSSPYASRPPPPSNTPIKTEDGGGSTAQGAPSQPHIAPALPSGVRTIPGPGAVPHQQPQQQPQPPPQPQPQQQPQPQPQHQTQASTASARPPSATPPAGGPARPVIEPRLLTAIVRLKNGLVDNLTKARNPKAEGIVMSALNRCVGLKNTATENDKMESICIKGIRQVIEGATKSKSPTPGGTTANPDSPLPILEAKVLLKVNGFKEVCIKTIKERLGEARAEAVTLSAIDRVLGLADASIVGTPAEGEPTGNLEGLEQHLMRSVRELLQGMNQRVREST